MLYSPNLRNSVLRKFGKALRLLTISNSYVYHKGETNTKFDIYHIGPLKITGASVETQQQLNDARNEHLHRYLD